MCIYYLTLYIREPNVISNLEKKWMQDLNRPSEGDTSKRLSFRSDADDVSAFRSAVLCLIIAPFTLMCFCKSGFS